jgi:hypothetical protein
MPGFQKKKARNLPKSFKNLDIFITFFFKVFLKFFQKVLLTMLLGIVYQQIAKFSPQKKTHWPAITSMRTYNVGAIEQPQTFMSFWVSQKTCKTFAKIKKDLVG